MWKIIVSFPRILTIPERWRHFEELQTFISGNNDTIGSDTSSPIFGFSSRFSPCLQNSVCLFWFSMLCIFSICLFTFDFVCLHFKCKHTFVYDKFYEFLWMKFYESKLPCHASSLSNKRETVRRIHLSSYSSNLIPIEGELWASYNPLEVTCSFIFKNIISF